MRLGLAADASPARFASSHARLAEAGGAGDPLAVLRAPLSDAARRLGDGVGLALGNSDDLVRHRGSFRICRSLTAVADREAAEDAFKERHEFLAKAILVLLALHVGAAMKHLFIDQDGVMESMMPPGAAPWIGVLVILGGARRRRGLLLFFFLRADRRSATREPG